jgi:hypothetical protein
MRKLFGYFFPFSTVKMIHVCVANERGIIFKAVYPLFSAAFKINNIKVILEKY